jgi:hypothetical protein
MVERRVVPKFVPVGLIIIVITCYKIFIARVYGDYSLIAFIFP